MTVTHFDNFLLRDYVNKFKGPTNASFEDLISDQSYFREKFTQFLFSPKGGIFQVTQGYSEKLQRVADSRQRTADSGFPIIIFYVYY